MNSESWKTLPFEEAVSSRGSGKSGLPQNEWLIEGRFPVIGQGAEDVEGWTNREDLLMTPTPAVVLYGGHTRRVKHVTEPFVPGPNVKILQPIPAVDSKFLYYFLTQLPIESKGYADHFPLVRKCEVPVPPPPEQQRIVDTLDKAFEAIATAKTNTEKNLQNARELFESYLQSVFKRHDKSWVGESIGSICEIKHGYAFDGADFSNDVPAGNPRVITPGNFTDDGKLLFNEKNTKRFKGKPPAGFRFNIGDLVIVMTDLSSKMKILGKPAFIETDDVLHNQRIGRVVFLNDRIEKRFLYYFMMSEGFLKNIKRSATGTMVKHTAPKRILSNIIYFPRDRRVQQIIIRKLDDIHDKSQRLKSIYHEKLIALEALKKSLLHQAFAGEL